MATLECCPSPLHRAARAGDLNKIKKLIKQGNYVNCTDSDGYTPLHYACIGGHLAAVRALASELQANLTLRDAKGNTPLLLAAESGHEEVVVALLHEYGCPVTDKNYKDWGVLHYACARGNVSLVKLLICNHNADYNARDKRNRLPIHVAAYNGNYEVVILLINEFGCSPKMLGNAGKSLLHDACSGGNVTLVQILINEHKADINCQDNLKNTPLHVAAYSGNYEVALSLIQKFGCNTTLTGHNEQTLLHYACRGGNASLVKTLITDFEADVSARDRQCNTPLHVAAYNGRKEVLTTLINEFDCDINVVDHLGRSVLHHACMGGNIITVKTLINEHNADIYARDNQECTPLHVAAYRGSVEVVLLLITEFGCDPKAESHNGRNILHHASQRGHTCLVKALLNFMSPLMVDEHGNTPLHLASEADKKDAAKCLLKANAPVLMRNSKGKTPIDIAKGECTFFLLQYIKTNRQELQINYLQILEQSKKKYSGSQSITRVFVLGNPGAGKSSFIESLKREGFFQLFSKVSESSVPPHTAGIIPSIHNSKHYGRALFYDFAGDVEYYSSHAAIFESLASSTKGSNVFVIVVNLMEDIVTISTSLHYWFSFIQCQKFRNLSLIVVGSHSDMVSKDDNKRRVLDQFCSAVLSNVLNIKCFLLDCRDPRSNQITKFKKEMIAWVSGFQKYRLSNEASVLLGLLEKDFSAVTACPVQTLTAHIKECGVCLPTETKAFHQLLSELHDLGVLLLLGECSKDNCHVILNVSKLTNEVHELLFSKSSAHMCKEFKDAPFNIGTIPDDVLAEMLPPHITKECLIHLQYCQEISHSDVGVFPSLNQAGSTNQSLLFFPALCSVDKSQVVWDEAPESFSMGWLALCTDPHDYFPSRFLHVLLLRLVYAFTLSVPAQQQTAHTSLEHSRRCTMWKTGVQWKMEVGVDCKVELVKGSKGVVVLSNSYCSIDGVEDCIGIFSDVVNCVIKAKADFCHSIKPQFFLLDSSAEEDYLNKDHLFAMSDVERALQCPEGKHAIISISGRGKFELSNLKCVFKLTHWNSLFPIKFSEVIHFLRVIVDNITELGIYLGVPYEFLESLETNFPTDINRRRREMIRWWTNSYLDIPCWWNLVHALRKIDENVLAEEMCSEYGKFVWFNYVKYNLLFCAGQHIQLQEKLLNQEIQDSRPNEEFLYSLSRLVGCRWPSLAVTLLLSNGEIEQLKEKVGLSQEELALQMLRIWALRKESTYGQLCHKLKSISLFHYST